VTARTFLVVAVTLLGIVNTVKAEEASEAVSWFISTNRNQLGMSRKRVRRYTR